jgi:pimeloyl-ACP methyl ester carboxylesterase
VTEAVVADAPAAGSDETHRLADGRSIGYRVFGDPDGLPVFALHGTPGSRLNFTVTEGPARARRLRIIAPDRPGCGLSDFKRLDAFEDWVADLQALADALRIDTFAVIGISGGGPYALAAAWALPERVQFAALVSPIGPVADAGTAIRLSPAHRRLFKQWAARPRTCRMLFRALRVILTVAPSIAYRGLIRRASSSDRPILRQEAIKRNLLQALREGLRRDVRGAAQDLLLFGAPWRIPFRDVIVPVVLWQGLEDRNVPPAASEFLADNLANCRLDVIPSGGHYWVFDHLDAVLDAVEASLGAGRGLA